MRVLGAVRDSTGRSPRVLVLSYTVYDRKNTREDITGPLQRSSHVSPARPFDDLAIVVDQGAAQEVRHRRRRPFASLHGLTLAERIEIPPPRRRECRVLSQVFERPRWVHESPVEFSGRFTRSTIACVISMWA